MAMTKQLYELGAQGPQEKEKLWEDLQAIKARIVGQPLSTTFVQDLLACILELPHKTYAYALLFAIIHEEHTEEVVSALFGAFPSRILPQDGSGPQWRLWKLMLRFYAELAKVGVFPSAGLQEMYANLVAVVLESNANEARKDCAVHLILSTLPWSGSVLQEHHLEDLQQMFAVLRNYIEYQRESRPKAATACLVFRQNCPYEQTEELVLLLEQVQDLAAQGWKTALVPDITELTDTPFTKVISFADWIRFPVDTPAIRYPLPTIHFEILTDAVVTKRTAFHADIPASNSMDHLVAYDILQDLIFHFDTNHREFTTLVTEHILFPASSPYNLHQMLIEALFTNIFRLPAPDRKIVYYGVLIMGLCKAKPKEMAPILGKVIYTIFERVQDLDVECQARFTTWFSHHLSNFDYRWNWAAWSAAKLEPKDSPHSLLIQETLEKCVRLSYYERVTRTFNAGTDGDMTALMPPQPEPNFKYSTSKIGNPPPSSTTGEDVEMKDGDAAADPLLARETDPRIVEFSERFLQGLRLKQPMEELKVVLEEAAAYAAESGVGTSSIEESNGEIPGMPLAREILVQCVLLMGSKSFSHTLNMMERHLELLKWSVPNTASKFHLVQVVCAFWHKNKQFLMIVLDKLVNYRILEPSVIVQWIFDPAGGQPSFTRTFVWTILKNTAAKVNARVQRVQRKLEMQRLAMSAMEEDTPNGDGTAMDEDVTSPNGDSSKQQQTSGEIAQLESELEALQREKKQLYLDVFRNFVRVLQPHIGTERESTAWFQWGEGMMREMGRHFHADLKPITTTLDMLVFLPAKVKVEKADVLDLSLSSLKENSVAVEVVEISGAAEV